MVDLYEMQLENDLELYYSARFSQKKFWGLLDEITVSSVVGRVDRFKYIFAIEVK